MWHCIKFCFDSRPWCAVTRPIASLVIAGVIAGVIGLIGGYVHGLVHCDPDLSIGGGLRLSGSGAVAGFVMGMWSGWDRLSWPKEEWGHPENLSRSLPRAKMNTEPPTCIPSKGSNRPRAVLKNGHF
jgi:hypothetical protein